VTVTGEKPPRDRQAGQQSRDVEVEQEVDLGRFWRAVLSRWWLPVLGLVAGAVIGLLVSIGGGKEYKATAEVYLGQPLSPSSSSVSTTSTSLAQATRLAAAEATIRTAAERAGYKSPSGLRGHVSTKPILGITGSKLGTAAPLIAITVTGDSRPKVARAANTIAGIVRSRFSPYSNQKLSTLKAQLERDKAQLAAVQQRLSSATQQQEDLLSSGLSSAEKLVAISALNSVISTATAQQLSLQGDQTQTLLQISQAQNIEAPRIVAPGAAASTGGPSRRSGVVIGAIIGFILGLIAAIVWQPVTNYMRSHPE
jgi:uncharacterized protein involved in exopolysaccharide biosynthesis